MFLIVAFMLVPQLIFQILDTPRARETVRDHTAWEPERVQRIREPWNDRFFRLFGELL